MRDTSIRTPERRLNEHLAKCALTIAYIKQRDRAHNFPITDGYPKVACASLIKAGNIQQIRLVGQRDRNAKFLSLN